MLTVLVLLISTPQATTPDFNRDVRPILSRYCFKCHGPDQQARQGGFRLDVRQLALAAADSGDPAIVPGNAGDSELVRRVFSGDQYEVMPPPETNTSLTNQQKEILRQWVASGADYQPHWAFVAPQLPAVPRVQQAGWPRNPIDQFVLARQEAAGLQPSPRANRYTLIRRLSLDLIGLPPTPDEVDLFVRDESPNAYERLVDRLLASQHYGERWARRWLDLARYADTNGYEKDRPRSIWPYRDWVIRALNDGMPFDQFTIEQIAGDMLPDATLQQRVATGFHRNTMLNEEGGIDPLEFRYHAITDRVGTTGTAWLGLTLMCAQCHSHKFDPISQREYYQLMAFLNNTEEPDLDLPQAEQKTDFQRRLEQAEQRLEELPRQLPEQFPLEQRFADWERQERRASHAWHSLPPYEATSNLPLLTVQDDDSVFASGDFTKSDTYQLKFRPKNLRNITAIRLEALPDARLPAHGPGMTYYEGTKGDFFLGEFQLQADGRPLKFSGASHSYAKNRFGKNPVSAELAIDGDPQTGWSVDARLGERHTAVFVLDQPLAEAELLEVTMTFGRHFASSLGRFRISVTVEPNVGRARDLSQEVENLLLTPNDRLDETGRLRLRHEFLLSLPELAVQAAEIRKLYKPPTYLTTLVMHERPPENLRPTYVHHRGEFLQPTDPVQPLVPEFLPPLPDDTPRNRLEFARWLVSRENPLTGRVAVNRAWAAFFGCGIVETVGDFGYQGQLPSHPQLLDWLAVQFMQQGWSLKWLHKQIVMSATYQQSSQLTPQLLKEDANNRLLARAPRVRLEAELIRDTALRISGLLSPKVGGPSVFPPQPAGVTTEGTYGKLDWTISQGEDRYRRGLYTFSKRTAPFAMFNTFDGPTGESCVARRDVSNTPLQALTLLNDVVFLEAAQQLGREFAGREEPLQQRVESLFRRVLVRPPEAEELTELVEYWTNQEKRFVAGELDAQKIAGTGTDGVNQQAAWTVLARVLLNLDEAITRD